MLIARLDDAEQSLAAHDIAHLPPASVTVHALIVAGIALRRLRRKNPARAALSQAERATRAAGIPALMAEVESATRVLDTPAARLMTCGGDRVLRLDDVEALFASKALIFDSCRYVVRKGDKTIWLASRRVLLAVPAR